MLKKLNNIINNKKGIISQETIFFAGFRLFVILASFLVLWFFIGLYFPEKIDIGELEAGIVAERLLYSYCFNFVDSNARLYPGMIDASKFTAENVNKCVKGDTVAYRLKLQDVDKDVKEFTANEELFSLGKAVCELKDSKEKMWCSKFDEYVLIYNNGKIISGILNIEVVIDV